MFRNGGNLETQFILTGGFVTVGRRKKEAFLRKIQWKVDI
jgi:hypothetical protein